jgi:3-oxo-5alpha-steroid 4-dehydrogenase
MCEKRDGRGWLILDRSLYRQAWNNVLHDKLLPFQRDPVILALLFQRHKGATLDVLAQKVSFDPAVFRETVRAYNAAASGQEPDPFQKNPKDMAALSRGPYYAIDVSITSRLFPLTTLTLGGLCVDEATGAVLRSDGSSIEGLYAAGRNAVGICSHLYVSGLSAADCIFSGRRAAASLVRP